MQEKLNIIRRFKNEREFQVGAELLRGELPTYEARQKLSYLADVVMESLVELTKSELEKNFGTLPEGKFAICAMGKLGGEELTFGSDLDLVFIYDAEPTADIMPSVYYSRLTQNIIVNSNTFSSGGKLYDIDARLRPSGKNSPIVSSLEAFEKYYKNDAWLWEFMALTRARIIYGNPEIKGKIEAIIRRALCQKRDQKELAKSVSDMRIKLAKNFPTTKIWDVKRIRGGLIDVDFISQYLQLLHAHKHPEILSRNSRAVFKNMEQAELLCHKQAQKLKYATLLLNAIQTIIRMTCGGNLDEENTPEGLKKLLMKYTKSKDFKTLQKSLMEIESDVLKIFNEIVSF